MQGNARRSSILLPRQDANPAVRAFCAGQIKTNEKKMSKTEMMTAIGKSVALRNLVEGALREIAKGIDNESWGCKEYWDCGSWTWQA